MTSFEWMPIRYRNVISVLKNPFYSGVYVYGKSEKRTEIIEGRARKSYGHGKPISTWDVIIKDHHQGYTSAGRNTSATRSIWRSTTMAVPAAPSRVVAAGRCCRAC